MLEVGQNLLSTFTIVSLLRDNLYNSSLISLHDVGVFRLGWCRKVGIYGGECDKVLKSARLGGFKGLPVLVGRSAGGGASTAARTGGLGSEGLTLRGVRGQTGGGGGEEDLDGSGVDRFHLGHLVYVFLDVRGLWLVIAV